MSGWEVTVLVFLLYVFTGKVWVPSSTPIVTPKEYCYYGSLQKPGTPILYVKCPPGHGVKIGDERTR